MTGLDSIGHHGRGFLLSPSGKIEDIRVPGYKVGATSPVCVNDRGLVVGSVLVGFALHAGFVRTP